jgi:hypothetical protein
MNTIIRTDSRFLKDIYNMGYNMVMAEFTCGARVLVTEHNKKEGTCNLLVTCVNVNNNGSANDPSKDLACPFRGPGNIGQLPFTYQNVPLEGQHPLEVANDLTVNIVTACLNACLWRRKTI